MEVLQTSNYERFTKLKGNRVLNQRKIDKIIADINAGLNLLALAPIIVSETAEGKLTIIDGQHRFAVCQKLNKKVYYLVAKDISLRDVARINSRQEKWSNDDFINCYIEIGINDYVELKAFIKKYRLTYTVAISLLLTGNPSGHRPLDKFRDGNFKCNHLEAATELMDLIESIFGRYKFTNDRNFIAAVHAIKVFNAVDWDKMKAKVKEAPNVLDPFSSSTKKEWIQNLELLYNHRAQKRTLLA